MNPKYFLHVLRARWMAALLVFVVVAVSSVAITYNMAKRYTATSSLIIDAKPDPVSSMLYGGLATPALMATQLEVVQSDRVAARVVRNLRLIESPQIRAQWQAATQGQGSIENWMIELLQQGLVVRTARAGGNTIHIDFSSSDPQFAATVADAFAQAYVEVSVELRVDPAKEYSAFFTEQVKEARAVLEDAQSKVSEFQRAKGLIATDERFDIETARLAALSQQLVATQGSSADSASRMAEAGANASQMQEVMGNALITGLKAELSKLELRLQELSQRYGENHPQVQEARASSAELKRRLAAETTQVSGSVSVSAKIDRGREANIRAELEAQRNKVMRTKEVRDEAAVLQRDVENAQRRYDAIFARFNQTNLESQARQSNASILAMAAVPYSPSSPKTRSNLVLGFGLAVLLALAIAVVLEMLDRRVRGSSDIVDTLGLPVLGTMPKPRIRGLSHRRKLALVKQRVISGRLPLPYRTTG